MNDQIKTHEQTDVPPALAADPTARSLARRRFLGAGSVAAPFVLTLMSQPALGGGICFTPSRSLSRNTSISQAGKDGTCIGAESPGNYKTHQIASESAYHWPASVPPSTAFHPLFNAGSSNLITKFYKPDSTSMSMGEVLLNFAPGDGNVAFHIVGAYLNKMGGNGAIIPDNVLTVQDIRNIWNEYAAVGYYTPTAGVQWNGTLIVKYLKDNYIVA